MDFVKKIIRRHLELINCAHAEILQHRKFESKVLLIFMNYIILGEEGYSDSSITWLEDMTEVSLNSHLKNTPNKKEIQILKLSDVSRRKRPQTVHHTREIRLTTKKR